MGQAQRFDPLRGGAAVRSMDERDPLVGAYLKLIETRSAWMPA